MSTAAVSSNLVSQQATDYFQQRRADLQQLSQDLKSGNLSAAQQDFSAIQTLAQSGPLAKGDAFKVSGRQQDFATLGQDLQSGNLAGAQQAFAHLQGTFHRHHHNHVAPPSSATNQGNSSQTQGSGISVNA
jgi:hypothetical protein